MHFQHLLSIANADYVSEFVDSRKKVNSLAANYLTILWIPWW